MQAWRPLSKRDSNTGIFLWILKIFLRTAFFIKQLWWLLLTKEILMKKIHSSDTLAINMVIPAKNVIISNVNNAIDREKPSVKLKWKKALNLSKYLSSTIDLTKTILTHSSHWNIITYLRTYSTEWNKQYYTQQLFFSL